MAENDFFTRLKNSPLPVVVDFWAPWCGPCRAIEPGLKKLGKDYEGRVDVWRINADEHAPLLRDLKIYGIPTLIAFRNGQEVLRRTGAGSPAALEGLFTAALSGEIPATPPLSAFERLLRLGVGLGLFVLAGMNGISTWDYLLFLLGAIVSFSAVHDRCPIWQALSPRLAALFKRK